LSSLAPEFGHWATLKRRESRVRNLDDALAEIDSIRGQIARSTEFRGYGPTSVAASGILALLVAATQTVWSGRLGSGFGNYLAVWVGVAAVALLLTGGEMIARTRREHCGLANEMIHSAAEQFLPAVMAGLLLTVVVIRFAPHERWMLPGLWQVVFSLGVFASCRFLPRQMFIVGVWYLTAGLICLGLSGGAENASPWMMGIPFGFGQLLVATVLRFGYREAHEGT
jgi:hypothetical protein